MTKNGSTRTTQLEDAAAPREGDRLLRRLEALMTKPSHDLEERIFDRFVVVPSPLADVFVAFNNKGVRYVELAESSGEQSALIDRYERRFGRPIALGSSAPSGLAKSLQTGHIGELRFDLSTLTPFERDVLAKTSEIPRGEVRPYGWVAAEIGRPRAVRATGSALAHNPIPLLIPCHRVVKSDGALGNYGLGTSMKEALLRFEGVDVDALHSYTSEHVRFVGSNTTHIVCYPTCRAARQIGARHRIAFSSLGGAQASGFRPCKLCRPIEGGPSRRPDSPSPRARTR
jgi:O-6-methylguanine DNA methyltransferase